MKTALDHRIDRFRDLIEMGLYYRVMNYNLDLIRQFDRKELKEKATLRRMQWEFGFYT
jgi:hypothetical protein